MKALRDPERAELNHLLTGQPVCCLVFCIARNRRPACLFLVYPAQGNQGEGCELRALGVILRVGRLPPVHPIALEE